MLLKLAAVVAAGTMTAIGLAGSATAVPATAQTHPAAVSSAAASFSKTYLYTVQDQWTHWTPDPYTSSHAGELYKGVNYFYCYKEGAWYSNGFEGSVIWLLTDDDTGHHNVYVSDTNLTFGDFTHDTEFIPHC